MMSGRQLQPPTLSTPSWLLKFSWKKLTIVNNKLSLAIMGYHRSKMFYEP